ncbi:MAG: DUF411 domain-containing protein [Nanoarchaeota archaeon]
MPKAFPALALTLILLAACSAVSKEPSITTVAPAQFKSIIKDRDVFVLDTHIPEGKHIIGTDGFIAYDQLAENENLLPKDKNTPIAVYCRSGSMSGQAAQTLQSMGYRTIYNLEGGTNAWGEAGFDFTGRSYSSFMAVDKTITVYKSPTCGCCVGYVAALEGEGFQVNVVTTEDMASIKNQYQIPSAMESCHTSLVGGYVVEGHVPIKVLSTLLDEQPDIDGIALPRMPSGTPGMPGPKTEKWQIYSLQDGMPGSYLTI